MLSLCRLSSRNTTEIVTFAREVAPGQALGTYDFIYGYLSLAFVCLKIYSISLKINIVKQNIRSPHNIGIQNPDLSILIKPIEIDVIERKIR